MQFQIDKFSVYQNRKNLLNAPTHTHTHTQLAEAAATSKHMTVVKVKEKKNQFRVCHEQSFL